MSWSPHELQKATASMRKTSGRHIWYIFLLFPLAAVYAYFHPSQSTAAPFFEATSWLVWIVGFVLFLIALCMAIVDIRAYLLVDARTTIPSARIDRARYVNGELDTSYRRADLLDDLLNSRAGIEPDRDESWIDMLIRATHILIVGATRSGKTVLTHKIAMDRSAQGHTVYVVDPDARPGMWPGCQVFGAGDNWNEADRILRPLSREVTKRRELRQQGQRDFPKITIVLSEAADVMTYCQSARGLFEDVVRRGGKINISMILDVQDSQVETLGIKGQSQLLINLTRVEVKNINGRRQAIIGKESYDIPQLPDPEDLADQHTGMLSIDDTGMNTGTGMGSVSGGIEHPDAEIPVSQNQLIEQLGLRGSKQSRIAQARAILERRRHE